MACGNNNVSRGRLSSGPVSVRSKTGETIGFLKHLTATPVPTAEDEFHDTCLARYREDTTFKSEIVDVDVGSATYRFDIASGRLVSMIATSLPTDSKRETYRQSRFPLERPEGSDEKYHRGHALSHKAGGGLEINMFPQLASVNVGKSWREFERYSVKHPGTPLSIAFRYTDETAVPSELEFTIKRVDGTSETLRFSNR